MGLAVGVGVGDGLAVGDELAVGDGLAVGDEVGFGLIDEDGEADELVASATRTLGLGDPAPPESVEARIALDANAKPRPSATAASAPAAPSAIRPGVPKRLHAARTRTSIAGLRDCSESET